MKTANITHCSITVTNGDKSASFTRKCGADGLHTLKFNITITPRIADILDKTGILEVESYSSNGTITYRKKSFYDSHKMIEIVTEILEREPWLETIHQAN